MESLMKIKNINLKDLKINFFNFIRYFYPITIVLIIIVLISLAVFLYKNVYSTLAEAKILTSLQKEVSPENLAKEKFYDVLDKMRKKTQKPNIDVYQVKNIFLKL